MRLTDMNRLMVAASSMLAAVIIGCGDANLILSSDDTGGDRVSETESLTRTVDAAAATDLIAETVNGRVSVRATDGDVVRVVAVKTVEAYDRAFARSFLQEIDLTIERRGDEVVVLTSYPQPPSKVNVSVRFEIWAPADLVAELTSVNGVVEVVGMERGVEVQTVNGLIDVSGTCGPVVLRTVNGLVSADLDELRGEGQLSAVNGSIEVTVRDGERPITATTVNGSVTVALPGGFEGSLDAQTANGRAMSGFAVSASGIQRRNRIVGSIGAGGNPVITLRSTNGNVWLRQAG